MVKCKIEDEYNKYFKMCEEIELCAVPYPGVEIVVGSTVWEVRKVQIDINYVWLTVRYVGE